MIRRLPDQTMTIRLHLREAFEAYSHLQQHNHGAFTLASEFLFWAGTTPPHVAQLGSIDGFAQDFHINLGVSHASDFPADAAFTMDPDYPDNTLLADQLCNNNSFTLVSARVRDALLSEKLKELELLPVRVLDHRKRDVGSPYYIVHPLGALTCLNRVACNILKENESRIRKLEKLVIDHEQIPKDRMIFRIENLTRYVCVRRELAQRIDNLNATGIRWVDPEELGGQIIPADLSSLPPRD